jgi:hypothetical protein
MTTTHGQKQLNLAGLPENLQWGEQLAPYNVVNSILGQGRGARVREAEDWNVTTLGMAPRREHRLHTGCKLSKTKRVHRSKVNQDKSS